MTRAFGRKLAHENDKRGSRWTGGLCLFTIPCTLFLGDAKAVMPVAIALSALWLALGVFSLARGFRP